MIKTVLAPNAPWPKNIDQVKVEKPTKAKKSQKRKTTLKAVDENFAQWYMKNGMFQHIQQLGRRRPSIFDEDFKKCLTRSSTS